VNQSILAEELKMSPRDLSMMINRNFNKNFYEFINHYRIEEAKKLLTLPENKSKKITEIYLESGFNSKSVFNTFFKNIVGMTPTQFRKNNV